MGLKDATSAFQKIVTQILFGLDGVFVYQGDILIVGKTQEEHDKILTEVLKWLEMNSIPLTERKLLISVPKFPFLGPVISSEGIEPDPKNVQDMLDAPEPKNVQEIQSFLGLCNYNTTLNSWKTLRQSLYPIPPQNEKHCEREI